MMSDVRSTCVYRVSNVCLTCVYLAHEVRNDPVEAAPLEVQRHICECRVLNVCLTGV
jgi:hypothetical protein